MADELTEWLRTRKPARFQPHPFYSKEGDFLTYFFEGVDHYAERMDDFLTVYLSRDNNRWVGFKLKGVAHLWKTLGDCFLTVADPDGTVRLSLFLTAGILMTKEPDAVPVYQRFVRQTTDVRVRKDEFEFCS